MRIGFLSKHNPFDRTAYSGTAFYMLQALQQVPGVETRVLGGHRPIGRFSRLKRRLRRRPPRLSLPAGPEVAGLDWILGLNSTYLTDRLDPALHVPLVHVTDATPGFLRTFYGRPKPPEADAAEARVLARAAHVIYSSDYMAARAAEEFGPELAPKLSVVPFGLNLDSLPAAVPEKPPLAPLELLFIGRDWERKGGDLALAALDILTASGVAARLTVIGANAPEAQAHPHVTSLGYLDKNVPADYRRMEEVFARSHLFVLPTRADCTPMVVAEANAYGIPVLITETGGISSLMAPERNGVMLPPTADGAAWAAEIRRLSANAVAYRELSQSSFAHCHSRLTWKAWAADVLDLLRHSQLA